MSKHRRKFTIDGQFVYLRRELLESDAYGSLSLAARKVLTRLEIEHLAHGGCENGRLPCTYDNFVAFGVRRKSIAPAIADLVARGLLEVTHVGRGGNGTFRDFSRYRLTYLHTPNGDPTNEWRVYSRPDSGRRSAPVGGG